MRDSLGFESRTISKAHSASSITAAWPTGNGSMIQLLLDSSLLLHGFSFCWWLFKIIVIGWAVWHQQVSPEMFPWLNICTSSEHTEQPSVVLIVVDGEKEWALWVISNFHFLEPDFLWFPSFEAGRSDCTGSPETAWWMFPVHLPLRKCFGGGQSADTGRPGWCPRGISYAAWPQASSLWQFFTSNISHSTPSSTDSSLTQKAVNKIRSGS